MLPAQVAPLRNPCLQLLPMQLFPKMPPTFLLPKWRRPVAHTIPFTVMLRQFLVVFSLLHFDFSTLKLTLGYPSHMQVWLCILQHGFILRVNPRTLKHWCLGPGISSSRVKAASYTHIPSQLWHLPLCYLAGCHSLWQSRELPGHLHSHLLLLCGSHQRKMAGSRAL